MRWITKNRFRGRTGKKFDRFIFAFFNSIGPERRLLRDSITSEIEGKAQVRGLRSK